MKINPVDRLQGTVAVPGDKSISHRYAILGAMAGGTTSIENFSSSRDCSATLRCVEALGVAVESSARCTRIESPGWRFLQQPSRPLDAENSGTTIRLLSSVLASRPMETTIGGDRSLNSRPMRRIIDPLTRMGAHITARQEQYPPLHIRGNRLRAIRYSLPVASAQVKSCVLLAGLTAEGRTCVLENIPSRDHTERALPHFGAEFRQSGTELCVVGDKPLHGSATRIPGDFSSAVFFLIAGLLLPGSRLELKGVGVNPSRTGTLQVLLQAGAPIELSNRREFNSEPVADWKLAANSHFLQHFPAVIGGEMIPNVIDEIPILAVLGTTLPGGLTITDAGELRRKESDRIAAITENLKSIGIEVEEWEDGFSIPPGQTIRGGPVQTRGDHRIAMAFTVAGLLSKEGVELDDAECAAVSFPDFFKVLHSICR